MGNDYAQIIEDQGWDLLKGRGLAKAQQLLSKDDSEIWAKKFGRKTVFIRWTGALRMYAIGDDGQIRMDWVFTYLNLDRSVQKFLDEKVYGSHKQASLRSQVIRLAHDNQALRPHLLKVLTAASGPLAGIFDDSFLLDRRLALKVVTLKTSKDDVDVTSEDDRDVTVKYSYPSQIQCTVTGDVKIPHAVADQEGVGEDIEKLIRGNAKDMFQAALDEGKDPLDHLDDGVEATGGVIDTANWTVTRADVSKVTVRVTGDKASITMVAKLDLKVEVEASATGSQRRGSGKVAGGSELVPALAKVFNEHYFATEDKSIKIECEAVKWARKDFEADEGYTVKFEYTSQLMCKVTIPVKGLPAPVARKDVEKVVSQLVEAGGKEMFQNSIGNESAIYTTLEEYLDEQKNSIEHIGWIVERVTVKDVDVRFHGLVANITTKVLLDIGIDTSRVITQFTDQDDGEDAYHDSVARRNWYDSSGDRYGSLRKEVIRLAATHPEFRKDLLPLLVK